MDVRVTGYPAGDLAYHYISPCEGCSLSKTACSKVFKCSSCKHKTCCPSVIDTVMRARLLARQILEGIFLHNDIVRYQLYLQGVVCGGKCMLMRTDLKNILNRLMIPDLSDHPEFRQDINSLPESLKEMVDSSYCCKIEWMYNGRYYIAENTYYEKNFVSGSNIQKISSLYGVAPKLVDTSGFDKSEYVYRAWLESVNYPGRTFSYTGACFWKDEQVVEYSKMRVQTHLYNNVCMVTVTTVSKSKKIIL